jgi:hypothetical protein
MDLFTPVRLRSSGVLSLVSLSPWLSACQPVDGNSDDDENADEGGDGDGPPEYECHAYTPGEPSHGDYTPGFNADDKARSPYEISYDRDPDALVQTAVYAADEGLVRVTLTGIMDVDAAHPSRPWDFHDAPVSSLGAESFAVELDGTSKSPSQVICSGRSAAPSA